MNSPGEGTFPEIDPAAKAAADDVAKKIDNAVDAGIPPTALTEAYKNETAKNLEYNRNMRLAAFVVFGLLCAIYLIMLLIALCSIGSSNGVAGILGAARDWHFLILVGMVLVVFSAVPLSIAMALVKMISEKNGDNDSKNSITTPHMEILKICGDIVKSRLG